MQEKNTIGIVKPSFFKSSNAIDLESGMRLDSYELIYETYGTLNKKKNNAILVCHALSGNHHLAGYYSKKDKQPG